MRYQDAVEQAQVTGGVVVYRPGAWWVGSPHERYFVQKFNTPRLDGRYNIPVWSDGSPNYTSEGRAAWLETL